MGESVEAHPPRGYLANNGGGILHSERHRRQPRVIVEKYTLFNQSKVFTSQIMEEAFLTLCEARRSVVALILSAARLKLRQRAATHSKQVFWGPMISRLTKMIAEVRNQFLSR